MRKKITFLMMAFAMLFAINTSAQVTYCEDLGTADADGKRSWTKTTFTAGGLTTDVNVGIPYGNANGVVFRGVKNTTPIDVIIGESLTIKSEGGFNWMYNFIWIDWNGDGVFDETTEFLGKQPAAPSYFNSSAEGSDKTRTYNISVPADAKVGETRVRVMFCWWSDEEPEVTACSIQSLTNNAMVSDFIVNVKSAKLEAPRTVFVMAENTTQGSAVITGTTDISVTTDALSVSVTALPNKGFFFDKWTSNGELVSTDNPFIYRGESDIDLTAHFIPAFYRPMSRLYTGPTPSTQQADRYITDAIVTIGTDEQVVVSNIAENPNPLDPATTTGQIVEGGVVDYTSNIIELPKGTTAFDLTAKGKTSGDGLQWTQQNVFVDWNGDYDFTDDGEAGVKSSDKTKDEVLIGDPGYTRTITLPEGLAPGKYQMRLIYHEPTGATSDWSKTIFESNVLRNGVAYDFVVELLSSGTGLNDTNANTLSIRVNNGLISVDGVEKFDVYSVSGQRLNAASALQSGVYIVKANNAVQKVLVK